MKARNGFVSNSSSSSFVVFGYSVSGLTYDDVENIEERDRITLLYGEEDGIAEGKTVIGYELASDSAMGLLDSAEFGFDDLAAMAIHVLNFIEEAEIKIEDAPVVKLFIGSRAV